MAGSGTVLTVKDKLEIVALSAALDAEVSTTLSISTVFPKSTVREVPETSSDENTNWKISESSF